MNSTPLTERDVLSLFITTWGGICVWCVCANEISRDKRLRWWCDTVNGRIYRAELTGLAPPLDWDAIMARGEAEEEERSGTDVYTTMQLLNIQPEAVHISERLSSQMRHTQVMVDVSCCVHKSSSSSKERRTF